MESNSCPICLNIIEVEYITECNHIFCDKCIYYYNNIKKNDIKCPLCREQIIVKDNFEVTKIKFDINNYPENPNIKDYIILSAYNTITKLNKWKFLYDYSFNDYNSFMFNNNQEILYIMNEINNNYGGHSGASLACAMRELQFIAHYGIDYYLKMKLL